MESSETYLRELARVRIFLACSLVGVVLLAVLDIDPANTLFLVLFAITVTMCLRRLREADKTLRGPIKLALAAALLSVVSSVIRSVHSDILHVKYQIPSFADPFAVASGICFLWSILTIVRRRCPRLGLDAILDACVATVAVGLLQWTLLYLPYIAEGKVSTAGMTMNIVFGTIALAEIAAAVLALVAGSVPSTSNRFLAAGLVGAFALDAMSTMVSAGELGERTLLVTSAIVFAVGGAGILHPSFHQLLANPDIHQMAQRLTRRRISVLALALLTPPVLMVWTSFQSEGYKWPLLPAFASLALSPLVITRLGRLVRQNEDMARLESTLRGVGEMLVSAETTEHVFDIIASSIDQVVGDKLISAGMVPVPFAQSAPGVSERLAPGVQALVEALQSDRLTANNDLIEVLDDDVDEWVAGLVEVQGSLRGALLVVTQRPLSREERNALLALCRESAIALRAVDQTEMQVRLRSEERFGALIDNSSDIVAVLSEDFSLTYVSPVVTRLLGYSTAEMKHALEIIHPDDQATASTMFRNIHEGIGGAVELRLRHVSGTYSWFEVVGTDMTADPNIHGVVINAREISDRKEAEEQLRMSEARFKALVQNSTDLVVVMDRDGYIRYASPSIGEVAGIEYGDVLNMSFDDVFVDNTLDWNSPSIKNPSAHSSNLVEFSFMSTSGEAHTIETTVLDLCSEPAINGYVFNARDVTYRKKMEQQLRYQATHDELTGMANRVHAVEDLTGMLERNSGSTTVAAILIDLDEFKDINDSLGHDVGDELLIAVAERIKQTLSFGDVAARTGGDEFAIVVERSHGESQIMELAESLMTALGAPFTIDGREISVTSSAGVVFDHDRSSSGELMLRNADTAMYRAKQLGKRQVTVFEPYMHTASFDRLELRADLARAVAHDQFVAFYQPVINIDTRRIVGAEALIRWEHPQRGLLGPGLFIPLAEETGLIAPMGEWILERACTDLARWRNDYGSLVDKFTMSVNLSAQQLHHHDIIGRITEILGRSGLPAERLVLEITESMLITETDKAGDTMRRIRDLGARLSIDDFGTGYSSLGYMQQFEFDVLKIDKSFIDDIDQVTNQRIVSAVLSLAENLGVKTIAEGIEEESQAEQVMALGCHLAQGYLFSRPVPEAEFRALLDRERSLASAEGK